MGVPVLQRKGLVARHARCTLLLVRRAHTIVVVVLTLTHGYNAVRGHRTGSNNSGAEDYFRRRKTNKNTEDNTQNN